jgi:Methyltransferase domain
LSCGGNGLLAAFLLGAILHEEARHEARALRWRVMNDRVHTPAELQGLYRTRFAERAEYRQRVWGVLTSFFSRWIPADAAVLDLGCGWCEFINSVRCARKFAMDMNPDARLHAGADVTVLEQDCSEDWKVAAGSLDAVFTSNFFEHLPSKASLQKTILQAHRGLRVGGRLIAMGPNIKYLPGAYWDFFDHHLALTELSLSEVLVNCGFEIRVCWPRFLPYTMSAGREYPIWILRAYLAMPLAWRFFGKQFLIVAEKKAG